MKTIIKYTLALALAMATGFIGGIAFERQTSKVIPNIRNVQVGYIAPSKLELLIDDQDSNGEFETIVKIDELKYLLRDVNGKPMLSKYRIWSGFRLAGDDKSESVPYEIQHID